MLVEAYKRGVYDTFVDEYDRAEADRVMKAYAVPVGRYAKRAANAIINRADPDILGGIERGDWRQGRKVGK